MINGPRIVQYDLIVYQPMYAWLYNSKFIHLSTKSKLMHMHMYHYATIFYEKILCLIFLKVILQEQL